MSILRCILAQLFIFIAALVISGQTERCVNPDVKNIGDEDLILKLSSDNDREATQGAVEIFKRGEKMIPFLLKLKGNKSNYRGYCLGNPKSADFMVEGIDEQNIDDGSSVTVEVASLYLISAIYYNNLAFANLPYLIGKERVTNFQYNTSERIQKAWKSTKIWSKKLATKGLGKLRETNEFPLGSTDVRFYGTNFGKAPNSPNNKQ